MCWNFPVFNDVNASLDTKASSVNGISPDENGNITVSGTLDNKAINMLIEVMSEGLYGTDQSGNIIALKHMLMSDAPTGLTATLSEAPLVGTSYSELDFTVTASYSNGDSAVVTGYTVEGGTVASGSNTATISYAGVTTTATFTASTTTSYTITYNLTGVISSDTTSAVATGTSYTTVLSVEDDYTYDSCTVTMGGTDVTSDVYSNMEILIESVTGDVVITATATQNVYMDDLLRTKYGYYSVCYMYSDYFETQSKRVNNYAVLQISEYPALSECTLTWTITNNSDSAVSITNLGIGCVPYDDSSWKLNNNYAYVAY